MNIIDRIIHYVLNSLFEKRDIIVEERLYLRRWFLKGRGTDAQWFLHNIRLPDEGRDHHDHPWSFVSLVLWGGYTENVVIFDECAYCVPDSENLTHSIGSVMLNEAQHTHRIDKVKAHTYTLVRTNKAMKNWRFLTRPLCTECKGTGKCCTSCRGTGRTIEFVDHQEYLGLPPSAELPLEDRL